MLNMALLNIMSSAGGGSGGMPDISGYNIFGLNSPIVFMVECGHYPTTVHIWNRHLTCFLQPFRCEDEGCGNSPHTIIAVGGSRTIGENELIVSYATPYDNEANAPQTWGIATSKLLCSYQELMWGFIDMRYGGLGYEKDIGKTLNNFISGYANYWEHLPPIPCQLPLISAANLKDFVGGTPWVAGVTAAYGAPPSLATNYAPMPQYTPFFDDVPRPPSQWEQAIVPIRGLTNFPKDDVSNQMMYGFMQLETPNQIGYGLSYSFGLAKNPDCLPKKSLVKCGGKQAGLISWNPTRTIFAGFAPFNLDNFLEPFIRAGKLRSYADASNVYADLMRICWNTWDYGPSTYKAYPESGRFYKSRNSIWQGLIDRWLEQPYYDIFMEIGEDPMYYINALQTSYPADCNFQSILGCGRSFDWGVRGNAAICAMVDAVSVFKALAIYPEEFPVDLPKLVARVG